MSHKDSLDEKDIALLRLLQQDGRISNADLARKVELSPPSVLQRVRRLDSQGYVKNYTAILDSEKMGYGLLVFANVSLALHQEQPIERFRTAIAKIPQVLECHNISGEFDFLLKIAAADMRDYERFIREELTAISSVGKIQSCFVLGTSKQATILPI